MEFVGAMLGVLDLIVRSDVQDSLEYIDWYIRDFPYGYAGLTEMLLDPSHCPFTLHGIGLFNRHGLSTPRI